MSGPEEEYIDPHGECAHEIASLQAKLAAAEPALAAARELAAAMISSDAECAMCGANFLFEEDHDKDCPVPVILTPATQEPPR